LVAKAGDNDSGDGEALPWQRLADPVQETAADRAFAPRTIGKDAVMPSRKPRRDRLPPQLAQVHLNAAGIDVGSEFHFVAVPADRDEQPVRRFSAFTADLVALADWLAHCGIETVVLESTGIYWIPLFELLESRGLEVLLVDPRRLKHVPGRKTDVLDCQWLQQLHTFGLLSGAFRPADEVVVLRSYLRQRAMLVQYASQHIQHMQKALHQMNVKLDKVLSDITGATGMAILQAILDGERDPVTLAQLRDRRCQHDAETIAKALQGNWRDEHLFALRQALALFRAYHQQIADCDREIEAQLATMTDRSAGTKLPHQPRQRKKHRNEPAFDMRESLHRVTGVDLTRIDGLDGHTVLKLISEIGTDMSRWKSVKHFTSWLGLCPGNKQSGGKLISGKTKRCANRAAAALRLAANGLHRSQTALGAYLRRMKARLGAPKAITATAHKLARLVYSTLKHGWTYIDKGADWYEQQFRDRLLKSLQSRALQLGYILIPNNAKG
jgi:transposase